MFRITSVCSFTGIADRDYKTLLQKVTKYVETRGKTIEIKVDVECGFNTYFVYMELLVNVHYTFLREYLLDL